MGSAALIVILVLGALVIGAMIAPERMQSLPPVAWASIALMVASLILVVRGGRLGSANAPQLLRYAGYWVLVIAGLLVLYFLLGQPDVRPVARIH
jgi:hypothetical protein